MEKIESTLDSREVAQMIGKEHHKLLRDVRRYIGQFTESNLGFSEFFLESEYKDDTGRTLPCYRITRKGCEFIANKLTGRKGTEFTARYINRFHEMEDIISGQQLQKESKTWYIRKFYGKNIVLYRDFITLTGVDPRIYAHYKRPKSIRLIPGIDYNGWGWRCNNDEFRREYGFDYGEDDCMMYLTINGFQKAIEYVKEEGNRNERELAMKLLPAVREKTRDKETKETGTRIQLNITINGMPEESTVNIC